MRKLFSGLALWLTLLGPGFMPVASAAASAATVSTADARAVQLVVRAQLEAFANDNAALAFSFAAPSIKCMFGTPENFLEMVRTGYPVVYRPASVTFLKPTTDAGEIVQPVHMTDGQGGAWLAVYRVQRQKDKSWRITGCMLLPEPGKAV